MPIYEYISQESGKDPVVIELLRSSADADKPVADPEGKGRVFKRRLSIVSLGGSAVAEAGAGHVHSGSCGCGKPRGSCGMG